MRVIRTYPILDGKMYMFVSHDYLGTENITYAVLSEDKSKMVEVHPRHGPVTYMDAVTKNIIEDYVQLKLERGNWSQSQFDENALPDLFHQGDLVKVYDILLRLLGE